MVAVAAVAAAAIGAGVSAYSASQQADASEDAAGMQQDAAREAARLQAGSAAQALDFQKQIYRQSQANLYPWRRTGEQALNALRQQTMRPGGFLQETFGRDDFRRDPGYQFRLAEGQKALERSAAARGNLLSGATLMGAQRYGQGLASQEYQNAFNRFQTERGTRFNRLAALAGIGQTATTQQLGLGQQFGAQASDLLTGAANAQAAGLIGAANAGAAGRLGSANIWGQATGNLASQLGQGLMNYYGMQGMQGGGGGGGYGALPYGAAGYGTTGPGAAYNEYYMPPTAYYVR